MRTKLEAARIAQRSGCTTLIANGAGDFCRHNNQAYADGTAALPFNYSTAHARFKTEVTSSCPTVPFMAAVPRHYWKTSVEWCSTRIVANNDKWRGFGQAGMNNFPIQP